MFDKLSEKKSFLIIFLLIIFGMFIYYIYGTTNSTDESEELFTDYNNLATANNMSLEKNNMNVILFYAPWCGYCKEIMPDWDRLYSKYNNKNINNKKVNIVKIDCDENEQIAKQYDIQGYPTIKLLSVNDNGSLKLFDYDDDRSYTKIEQFVGMMANN